MSSRNNFVTGWFLWQPSQTFPRKPLLYRPQNSIVRLFGVVGVLKSRPLFPEHRRLPWGFPGQRKSNTTSRSTDVIPDHPNSPAHRTGQGLCSVGTIRLWWISKPTCGRRLPEPVRPGAKGHSMLISDRGGGAGLRRAQANNMVVSRLPAAPSATPCTTIPCWRTPTHPAWRRMSQDIPHRQPCLPLSVQHLLPGQPRLPATGGRPGRALPFITEGGERSFASTPARWITGCGPHPETIIKEASPW